MKKKKKKNHRSNVINKKIKVNLVRTLRFGCKGIQVGMPTFALDCFEM